MKRKLLSVAIALSVLGIGGASLAGGASPLLAVKVVDYTPSSGDLVAQLPNGSLSDFTVTDATSFTVGTSINQLPPSPCRGVYSQWNRLAAHNALTGTIRTNLLLRAAKFQCRLDIELPPSPVGPQVLTIRPPTREGL